MIEWRELWRTAAVAIAIAAMPASAQVVGERVIGGRDAAPGSWPYQAFVKMHTARGDLACGGTLIAPEWILTAAHCAVQSGSRETYAPEIFEVRLGSIERSRGGELRKVKRVIVHEGYSSGSDLANDIALLQLNERSAQPAVQLEGEKRVAQSVSPWAKVIGWGVTNLELRNAPERLQEASLPLVDIQRCDAKMSALAPKAGKIDHRRICAGASEGGVDSCNGDSGGPLLVSDGGGGWLQVGIVSYGVTDCGRADTYGVYTRVSFYSGWIGSHTGSAKPVSAAPPPPLALGVTAGAPGVIASATQSNGPIKVELSRRDMRIGDPFDIVVTSAIDGYLALFDLNERNELVQLFPNPRSMMANKGGTIRAGAPLRLPDATYGFALEASEPKGRGRIIAVVSSSPEALATFRAEDGFSAVTAADQRLARLDLVLKGSGSASDSAPRWAAGLVDYVVR